MGQWEWLIVVLLITGLFDWLRQGKNNAALQRRVLDLEIRLHKLQEHLGFVADTSPPVTVDVQVLARTPGSKIAAIKLYREQTGAGSRTRKTRLSE